MNILFFTNSKLNSKSLGGIETLNLDLAKFLTKTKHNIYITSICNRIYYKDEITFIPINTLKNNHSKYNFDIIIGSNDTSLYSYFKKSKKILWLHNKLQVEKSIRKKIFFPINYYRPYVVFVSDYLKKVTSNIFLFKKKVVINNFLPENFLIKKINYRREKIFIWSVQRERGLDKVIEIWINEVFNIDKSAKFYIFGVNKKISKSRLIFLRSKNIYFYGRVSKSILKKTYQKSLAMICLGYDETFCLNALEANSCGLPIITFAKTALKNYSIHNHNSIIANDFHDLGNKIIYLLSLNRLKKKKFIMNSYNHSKKYHLNKISKIWLNLFKNI